MTGFGREVRVAARALRRRPGFTLVAGGTLALAIGSVVAVLALVDAVLLRPLPYPGADRVVVVRATTGQGALSLPTLRDLRRDASSFAALGGFVPQSVNLTGLARPDRLRGGFVSADFFRALGVRPERGRDFAAEDEAPGAAGVVVVSDAVWRDRLGADPAAVGRAITLNGEPFTVIGVLPRTFAFPLDEVEIWLQDSKYPSVDVRRRDAPSFYGIGRLRPEATLSAARRELLTLGARQAAAFPAESEGLALRVDALQEIAASGLRPSLLLLLAAVGFILLVACANVANLLLARGVQRGSEIAVRSALGAGGGRLTVQLLAEPLLLAAAGALAGLLLARPLAAVLVAATPNGLPAGMAVTFDARVVVAATLVALLAAALSGLVPAWVVSRRGRAAEDLRRARHGGRGASGGVVLVQVALAVVLLVGAGLLARSFWKLAHAAPGFDAERVASLEYRLPRGKYADGAAQWRFHERVVERAAALPGVTDAALVSGLPLSGNGASVVVALPAEPAPEKGRERRAMLLKVTPRYFAALGIPVLRGRTFAESDTAAAPLVAIVNRTLAEGLWKDGDAVGRRLVLPEAGVEVAVVGVVGDARQYTLGEPARPQIYGAFAQNPGIFATLVARTTGDPAAMGEALRGAVWAVDPDQPVWKVRSLQMLVEASLAPSRVLMTLVGAISALTLALSALGLFGVMSYVVGRRTREFGIRMALGATRADVAALVRRRALRVVAAGTAAGCLAAAVAAQALASFLYGVSTRDLPTYAAAVGLVLATALAATAPPAWRAGRVAVAKALRDE